MKSKKTNILLGVIAINLTLLTLIQLEVWPTNANANELGLDPSINYGLVPLNEGGSIDVNISSTSLDAMIVDIQYVNGHNIATKHVVEIDGEDYSAMAVAIAD